MGITVYLVAALAILGAIAGAGLTGYHRGQDNVRAEVALQVEQARNAAEAKRKAEADSARKYAADLQTTLDKQRRLSRDLGNSLAKHIAALPPRPAGCPPERLTDELLDDANRALAGPGDAAGGKLPGAGRTAADPDRPNDDRPLKPAR